MISTKEKCRLLRCCGVTLVEPLPVGVGVGAARDRARPAFVVAAPPALATSATLLSLGTSSQSAFSPSPAQLINGRSPKDGLQACELSW